LGPDKNKKLEVVVAEKKDPGKKRSGVLVVGSLWEENT